MTSLSLSDPESSFAFDASVNGLASDDLQSRVCQALIEETAQAVLSRPDAGDTLEAFEHSTALAALPNDIRTRTLLHPSFRYWLQAVRRTSVPSARAEQHADFKNRLPDFLWSGEAVTGTLTRERRVFTDEAGGLRCPSLGRFIELGSENANREVRISPAGAGVTLQCGGVSAFVPIEDLSEEPVDGSPSIEEHGYALRVAPQCGGVEVSSRDRWLCVTITGTNQRTDGTEFFGSTPEQYAHETDLPALREAMVMIASVWPEGLEDLRRFARVIVPMAGDATHHRAFTVSSRQGAIFIGPAPAHATVEMLLHETAHVKLRQIQMLDPLLRDPLDDSTRVPVPWRPDPRPIPGILEGVFVFAHVAEFERRMVGAGERDSRPRLEKLVRDLRYAADVLERHAALTTAGEEFFGSVKLWIQSLAAGAC